MGQIIVILKVVNKITLVFAIQLLWYIYISIYEWWKGCVSMGVETDKIFESVAKKGLRLKFLLSFYIFFAKRDWVFLLSMIRGWRFFFRPREAGFPFFRDPWNMHLLKQEPATFAWIYIFTSILWRSLKLGNCTELDVKLHIWRACGWRTKKWIRSA
mgnify:CR=1 FL=1